MIQCLWRTICFVADDINTQPNINPLKGD